MASTSRAPADEVAENVQVVVRVRPQSRGEKERADPRVVGA
jgi:hypothetical protein